MILIVVGTRPDIIKMSPIVKELKRRKIDHMLLHTNQHYDKNMSGDFLDHFGMNENLVLLDRANGFRKYFDQHSDIKKYVDLLMVLGDTTSAFEGAYFAKREGLKLVHAEAGLRSIQGDMYEEQNRRMIDHISDVLFAPTNEAYINLMREGIQDEGVYVYLTGNTISDVVDNLKMKEIEEDDFILLTIHRRENLHKINQLVNEVFTLGKKIIFPIHPHSAKYLYDRYKHVTLEPMDYITFMSYLVKSNVVITDSGGLQEETCILKKHCITLREDTERPETLLLNNILCTDVYQIKECYEDVMSRKLDYKENPYGNNVSKKIVDILEKYL